MQENIRLKRARRYWKGLCVLSVMLVLNACASVSDRAPSGEADTLVKDLLVSSNLDGSEARTLDGTVVEGHAYFFMAETRDLARVDLYVDKEEVGADSEPYSTLYYDGFETSKAADSIETDVLEDGVHTLSATLEHKDGSVREVEATFLVDNNSSLADQLLVSRSSSRSKATLLGSDTLTGDAYIFIIPSKRVKQIAYYLDDEGRKGRPSQIERIVHYDFAGTANSGRAQAFNTRRSSDGRHSVTAHITYASGGTKVVSKAFRVDNGATAPRPPTVPEPTSGGFPLNMFGSTPEAKKLSVNVRKPSGADSAKIVLETFDADRWGEGRLYVNGKGPLRLFDKQATSRYHDRSARLTFSTPIYWWRDGSNTIEVRHVAGEGFRLDKMEVVIGGGSGGSPSPEPTNPRRSSYSLRGNPGFSTSSLTNGQREWYSELWEAIENPDQHPNAIRLAKSDDIYEYRGDLQSYVVSLLLAFRMTGDLRLLDRVDKVAQLMRAELEDSWRGTRDGTNGKRDGFLNWVNRYDTATRFAGKDVQQAFELKAHALVAMIAYTLHNNRDLRSPSGVNYGAHADYWKNYSINHFEKKWRKRNGKSSGFPFAGYTGLHTYHSWMKWHYYMGKLTGKSAYSKEAQRMADTLWNNNFKQVSSKYGTAIVWSRGVLAAGSDADYLMPQGYARHIIQEAVDFHFEGFHKYASDSTMRKFANTVAAFVIDDNSFNSFARDIGGGRSRAGYRASSSSWRRMNKARFAESAWSAVAAWDKNSGNRIQKAAEHADYYVENERYGHKQQRVFIPAGLFLKEMLQ